VVSFFNFLYGLALFQLYTFGVGLVLLFFLSSVDLLTCLIFFGFRCEYGFSPTWMFGAVDKRDLGRYFKILFSQ
jgi:hypothetical protein